MWRRTVLRPVVVASLLLATEEGTGVPFLILQSLGPGLFGSDCSPDAAASTRPETRWPVFSSRVPRTKPRGCKISNWSDRNHRLPPGGVLPCADRGICDGSI